MEPHKFSSKEGKMEQNEEKSIWKLGLTPPFPLLEILTI